MKGGSTVIAFVEDPTGYKFELIQRAGDIPEPLAQVGTRRGHLLVSVRWSGLFGGQGRMLGHRSATLLERAPLGGWRR